MERALYLLIGLGLLLLAGIALRILWRDWVRARLAELIELLRLWHARM